ncbi:MAG: hypothetical protein IJC45_07010, partial [Clostridia bacterium]|nr:hypothetical protein [Clostridia bacterium]
SPIAMGETPLSPKKRRRVEKQLSIVFRREPSPGVLYCAKGTTITNDLLNHNLSFLQFPNFP